MKHIKSYKIFESVDSNLSFEEIYRTMWDKMLNGVCMKYTRDINKAKDYCQDGFIKVSKNLHKYNGKGSLEGWVRRIIGNNILDGLRSDKVRPFNKANQEELDFSRIGTAEEEVYEEPKFTEEDVKRAVSQLSPAYKEIFSLYYFSKLKHDEIASKLGISSGTSKSNLFKAKKKIRNILNEEI